MYPGFARGLGWRGRRMCFNNSDNSSIADSAIVPARTQTHSFNFLRHVTPNLLPFLVSFMWLLLCFAATAFSVAALTIVFFVRRPCGGGGGIGGGSGFGASSAPDERHLRQFRATSDLAPGAPAKLASLATGDDKSAVGSAGGGGGGGGDGGGNNDGRGRIYPADWAAKTKAQKHKYKQRRRK